MFGIGQYVICGNKGVCIVENITTLDISGVDKAKKYYILKPKYVSSSTVYVPVDSAGTSMREVLTKAEAEELIKQFPEIPVLEIECEKLAEQVYKACMKSNSCKEWVRLLKTLYMRRQKRLEAGRKETAMDMKYFRIAEESLYGELAVALEMERCLVADYLAEQLQDIRMV